MERHRSWSHSILEAGSGLTFGSSDLESDTVFSLLAFLDSVVLHLKDSKGIKAPQGEHPLVLSIGSSKAIVWDFELLLWVSPQAHRKIWASLNRCPWWHQPRLRLFRCSIYAERKVKSLRWDRSIWSWHWEKLSLTSLQAFCRDHFPLTDLSSVSPMANEWSLSSREH